MTAFFMAVGGNGVLMLSDGAAYDEAGVLRQIHSKQLIAPDIDLVLSSSGSGPTIEFIRLHLSRDNPLSFDQFHDGFPLMLKRVMFEMVRYYGRHQYAALVYGGYSEKAGKYVGFFIASYVVENLDEKPFTAVPITVFGKPFASAEMIERHDLGDDAYDRLGPLTYGLRFMLAVRRSPYALHGPGTQHGHGVGGYVEQTFLQKGCANTQIIWRWPDEIGRIIDPSNDPEITLSENN